LGNGNSYYLFTNDLSVHGNENVTIGAEFHPDNIFTFDKTIKSVYWLDSGDPLNFTQNGKDVNIETKTFKYGEDFVVRIAKIETQ